MPESRYIFYDKTGKCFDKFAKIDDYHSFIVRAFLKPHKSMSVGDMMCFRDGLIQAGFKWDKDFYITRV